MAAKNTAAKAANAAVAAATSSSSGSNGNTSMRLLAIPLARAKAGAHPIVTYVAQRAAAHPASSSSSATSSSSFDPQGETKTPLATRLLTRASNFWMDLGKPGAKSTFDWKRRTYNVGEKLMDRIDYTEWSLKAIDPALGPEIKRSKSAEGHQEGEGMRAATGDAGSLAKEHGIVSGQGDIPLLYPSTLPSGDFRVSPTVLLGSLRNLVSHRTPHHRQRLIYCVVGMPFTIPFALVPVIPNLPFFYLCWRAYSHWKAWKASEYLQGMIALGRIKAVQSKDLEDMLAAAAPLSKGEQDAKPVSSTLDGAASPESSKAPPEPEPEDERMILQPHHIDLLNKRFDLDRQSIVDLRRARMQAQAQLQVQVQAQVQADEQEQEQQQQTKCGVLHELQRVAQLADKEQQEQQGRNNG
ncbi:hypothetical protein K437DRAFT_234783 [Tilletiaria anomala UBC 951]|uniref:Mitochondrial K+-H+ exchange-related-domain-containing protein n=1 Tax=Tilletiaria anomala (strain ATCC 24038 / CBS 436.72 / UBC 951) TaxID=1037660 RepID=A0A066W0Y3_TILAU|nr:uncharacterized protein K437DRAFT_234783 [Tilletiaria anomala UBC 951]KDN47356.1 hypothetical protein K437DRAFT_234783 [Tilletiaria anomala UBC 951]